MPSEWSLDHAAQPFTQQLCPTSMGWEHKQHRQRGGRVCLDCMAELSVHLSLHFNILVNLSQNNILYFQPESFKSLTESLDQGLDQKKIPEVLL